MSHPFTVSHPRGDTPPVWWRAYGLNANGFGCGCACCTDWPEGQTTGNYSGNEKPIFAWLPHTKGCLFSAHELVPLPKDVSTPTELSFESYGDGDGKLVRCIQPHWIVYITNKSDSDCTVSCHNGAVEKTVAAGAVRQEVLFQKPTDEVRTLSLVDISITWSDSVINKVSKVASGETITVDGGQSVVSRSTLDRDCPIPVYDIAIRCINHTGSDVSVHVIKGNSRRTDTVRSGPNAYIIWMDSQPDRIDWWFNKVAVKKPDGTVPYTPGMTLAIRRPEQVVQANALAMAGHNKDHSVFSEFLDDIGELKYAPKFAQAEVEWSQLPKLSDADFAAIGIPVGTKLRILDKLQSIGLCEKATGEIS